MSPKPAKKFPTAAPPPVTVRPQAPSAPLMGSPAIVGQLIPPLMLRHLTFGFFLLGVLLYANTFFHDYALDDEVVLINNRYVQEGISGIPKLLYLDSFHGYLTKDTDFLPGGRYRPLSLITFAIENSLVGNEPIVSHGINILLYGLLLALIAYWFSSYLLPKHYEIGIIALLIFAVHPIHTEVVANIKSRDELLSLTLLVCMFICLYRALERPKEHNLWLGLSAIAYFLALMAKEIGITMLAIIPITLMASTKLSKKAIVNNSVIFLLVAIAYLVIRFSVIGTDFQASYEDDMTNPFMRATPLQKYATLCFLQLKYIGLLFWPQHLSWDYSYPQIPYFFFDHPLVLTSLVVLAGLIVGALYFFKRQNWISYGLIFYFSSISIVSNFVLNIGAPIGERFAFQASLGFCIAIAAAFVWAYRRLYAHSPTVSKMLAMGVLVFFLALGSYKTYSRNEDWQDSVTISMADVQTCPNSGKTNMSAGGAAMVLATRTDDLSEKMKYYRLGLGYFRAVTRLTPDWKAANEKMGNVYYEIGKICDSLYQKGATGDQPSVALFTELFGKAQSTDDIIMAYLDSTVKYNPNRHNAWSNRGHLLKARGQFDQAIVSYQKAQTILPDTAVYWYQVAAAYFTYPNNPQYTAAIPYFEKAKKIEPNNVIYLADLGVAYYYAKDYEKARVLFEEVLKKDPKHPNASMGLEQIKKLTGK
jgi:protein O-mannosyl-transferase